MQQNPKNRRSEFSATEKGMMDGIDNFEIYQNQVQKKMIELANDNQWIYIENTDIKKTLSILLEDFESKFSISKNK